MLFLRLLVVCGLLTCVLEAVSQDTCVHLTLFCITVCTVEDKAPAQAHLTTLLQVLDVTCRGIVVGPQHPWGHCWLCLLALDVGLAVVAVRHVLLRCSRWCALYMASRLAGLLAAALFVTIVRRTRLHGVVVACLHCLLLCCCSTGFCSTGCADASDVVRTGLLMVLSGMTHL